MSVDGGTRAQTATRSEATAPGQGLFGEVNPRRGVKSLLPGSLFGRSLLIIVIPVMVLQVVAAYYFYSTHWSRVSGEMTRSLVGELALLVDAVERANTADDYQTLLNSAAQHMDVSVTLESEGTLPLDGNGPGLFDFSAQEVISTLEQRVGLPFAINLDYNRKLALIELYHEAGVLRAFFPRKRVLSHTSQVFLVWLLGTGVVLFAVALLFMRNQIRPIRRLARAAESFGKGHEVVRFKPEGAREVRQAARAFLVMRDRIRRYIDQRTEMLAGVSHDLRTPLMRMRLRLAMLSDTTEVAGLTEDVAEMVQMIDDYLAFARGEGGEATVPVDIREFLGDIVAAIEQDGGHVRWEILGVDGPVDLRSNTMRRCITNLLTNARLHARHIWLAVRMMPTTLEIVIDDDGPGIPEEEREAVFKPFYRRDHSRNRATGGSGLGLVIAREAVRAHGGDILLLDAPQGGLRVRVRLPR